MTLLRASRAASVKGRWPSYSDMKPINIEWIGEIPSHWATSKLGARCSVKARLGWKGLKASEYVDDGYILLSTPNIKSNAIDFTNVNYITESRYRESPEIMLEIDDVLIAKDGSTLGISNVIRGLPRPATVNSSIAVIRSRGGLDPLFLNYFFSSSYFQSVIEQMKDGMGVPHLFQADLRKFSLIKPPMEEQRSISTFLDRETAKIDALIAKKQRLIELIEEKRTALINHAVTKGVDPGILMKESGIDSLGQIPRDWELLSVRRFATSVEQGWSPVAEDRQAEDEEWAVIKLSAIHKGHFRSSEHKALPKELIPERRYEIRDGDFLITRSNTPDLVGDVCVVGFPRSRLMLCDLVYRVQVDEERIDKRFLSYSMLSQFGRHQITVEARGSSQSMVKIAQSHVRSLMIVAPRKQEQQSIVRFLDESTGRIDRLVSKVGDGIEKLHEYRTALISAAVTGKIDVRGEAPDEPEELS